MGRFIARRLMQLVPTLFGLSILLFIWPRQLPGGPETALLGDRGTPEQLVLIRQSLGLDEPLIVQYGKFLERLARFDLARRSPPGGRCSPSSPTGSRPRSS